MRSPCLGARDCAEPLPRDIREGDVEGHVEANGVLTYYESTGDGSPLLFLHGGVVCGAFYPDQRDQLSRHYRVIMPDRRGHGRTADKEGPMSYQSMTDDTVAFMDAIGLDRAHIVGHSDGANIGMLMAIAHAERVDKLVLISGNSRVDGMRPEVVAFMRDAPDDAWADWAALWRRYSSDPPGSTDRWPAILGKLRACWLNDWDLSEENLGRIVAPTLVMGGDRDMTTLEDFVAQYRAIPSSQLAIVPNGGHELTSQRAMIVNQAVLEFLGAV